MEKIVQRGFAVLLALFPVLMLFIYAIPQNIVYNPEDQVTMQELSPVSEANPETGVYVYTFDISDRPYACDTLFVESLHSEVSVYADDELLYSLKRGEKPWMNTTGTVYDSVYLPDDVTLITVETRNLYPNISSNRADFFIGSGSKMSKDLSRGSFFPTMISALDVFIGIIMLIVWYYFRKQGQIHRNLFYLSFFSVAVGCWSMSESNNFILIVSNPAAASFTSYMFLMLFVVPFVQFTKYYFEYHPRFADVLSLSAIITHLLIIVLHITGIAGLKQTITLIHIHMAIAAVFYVYCFVRYMKDGKQKRRKLINIIAVIILIGSSVIDFVMYFSGNMQATFAGRFGLMIYLFILGTETVSVMVEELQESRKSAIYKELAFMDNLTGLYNRNAYMVWEKNLQEESDTFSIINIDLNDLKKCNDQYGHLSGDKYITDSAQIIYDTFHNYGKCYRVGGDEFVVVLGPKYSEAQIRVFLGELEERQKKYNRSSSEIQMHMACGYAKFDPERDSSFKSVCSRADARMYAHKKLIKEMLEEAVG